MTDRTNGRLDRAIVAYRNDPSDENRIRLLALQREHVEDFYQEQARELFGESKRRAKTQGRS